MLSCFPVSRSKSGQHPDSWPQHGQSSHLDISFDCEPTHVHRLTPLKGKKVRGLFCGLFFLGILLHKKIRGDRDEPYGVRRVYRNTYPQLPGCSSFQSIATKVVCNELSTPKALASLVCSIMALRRSCATRRMRLDKLLCPLESCDPPLDLSAPSLGSLAKWTLPTSGQPAKASQKAARGGSLALPRFLAPSHGASVLAMGESEGKLPHARSACLASWPRERCERVLVGGSRANESHPLQSGKHGSPKFRPALVLAPSRAKGRIRGCCLVA